MGYLGSMLFAAVFLLINPTTRAALTTMLDGWSTGGPLSYALLAILLVAPFCALLVLKYAPKIEEPENPLAKYKHEILPDD